MNARAVASALACALVLCGCASPPPVAVPAGPPEAAAARVPPAAGSVVAGNDDVLVYVPRAGDTLAAIAARYLGDPRQDWLVAEHNRLFDAAYTGPRAGEPMLVPLKPANPLGVRVDRYQTVPILCYHRFTAGSTATAKMSMPIARFAAQLDWLAANGFRVLRLADLQGFLEGRQALPERSVVLTIDDGYESVYRLAYPLLKAHGFPATVFVYTDFIGAGDALRWPQLREMADSGLVDVQSHSKSHRNLIDRAAGETDAQYRLALDTETRVPRVLIEQRLDTLGVEHYAYPFGDANAAALQALERSRYRLAVTVNPGGNAFFSQPLMLRRTMVYGDMDLDAFKAKLQTSRPLGSP